jgi:uncharacterized protein (DUF1697 family)
VKVLYAAKYQSARGSAGLLTGEEPPYGFDVPRFAAFLRAVSPMNAKMPELRRAFEKAGFTNVVTVLSSGNVVFDAERAPVRALERRAEAAMQKHMGHSFVTIIRPVNGLKKLLAADPFTPFKLRRMPNG